MNITTISSNLDWKTNNKGAWKALIKDLEPNGTITFSEGYTATVSGRLVTVTNSTKPVGTVTYAADYDNAINAGLLYGAGSASDSFEAVAGDKTVRMGSVDLGTLDWSNYAENASYTNGYTTAPVSGRKFGATNLMTPIYVTDTDRTHDNIIFGYNGALGIVISDSSLTGKTKVEIQSILSGVMLYYELAEPTTSTETPQSLSLTTGDDTLSGGSFDAAYEGTDYSIPLIRNCKYLHRSPDGTEELITGSTTVTSVNVTGAQDKLVNLTHWFGKGKEPSINDFYKLYPTWKTYDIPYDQGSVLNYKGTSVETIGFNAYDHLTGTAALLGGNQYQICGTYTSVSYVDIFGNVETLTLDGAGCFTPVNDGTLTVAGGNGTDTCVHLVWSGYKNYGEPEYKWEPFTRNVKELPISAYFPEGMNSVPSADGTGVVSDELTSEQVIQRIGVVDLGTLTYNDYNNTQNSTYPYGYVRFTFSGKASGSTNQLCLRLITVTSGFGMDKSILGTPFNNTCYIVNSGFIGMTGAQIKAALSGVLCYYELATPVVTQIDQPLNLAYPVNDFGTEHSLPQNTTTLVTTDLKALIKYNTDYMRMNSQLAPIFPTVKSLAKQEQDGYIMKKDDTAPNAIVGGAYNLIDRNAEGTERQFSFDTAGGSQDITDGTAVAKKSMGTTLNLNQLVKESVEKTESSATGVLEVSDAVAGDAKSLVMVAPRSAVVNQLFDSSIYSADNSVYNCSIAYNKLTGQITVTSDGITATVQFLAFIGSSIATRFIIGHKYIFKSLAGIRCSVKPSDNTSITDATEDGVVFTADGDNPMQMYISASPVGAVYNVSGYPMLVDLTQYFNGDQTLIDSITSWDDLVAYDPRFASYVEYNTGTVAGVQPTVAVNSYVRNQLIQNGDFSDGTNGWLSTYHIDSVTASDGVLTVTFNSNGQYSTPNISSMTVQAGHAYMVLIDVFATDEHLISPFRGNYVGFTGALRYVETNPNYVNQWHVYTARDVAPRTMTNMLYAGTVDAATSFKIRRFMFVDLTVLCHGHQSLIDQIQTWDDLVAFAPDYANYVAFDSTGTEVVNGGTAQAPAPLFAVGNAADEFEVVSGVTTRKIGSVDMGTLGWAAYTAPVEGGTSPYGYTSALITDKANGVNVLSPNYVLANDRSNDKTLTGTLDSTRVYLIDTALVGMTSAQIKTALSGVTLYYELTETTTSTSTPVVISLQAGNNTVVQTDGGRTLESLGTGYVGTDYEIATKSARKYVRTIDGTTELVTGVSSVSVRGGRDNLIDLTRMFGAGLEPGTLDDFYSLFPAWRGYRLPYNEGSLLNFKGTGLKSVGFNQFSGVYSEEGKYLTSTGTLTTSADYNATDYLRAVPGQAYRLTTYGNAPSICWYTYDKTLISGTAYGHASTWQEDVFTAPANAYWVRFSVYMPREAETCFYFQWSGTRNGDYEPYWDYVRPIPTLTYFPDGMNGRGSVYDEINDRQAVRRFAKVDLGTLEWTWTSASAGLWFTSGVKNSVKKVTATSAMDASLLSDRFIQVPQGGTGQLTGASNHVGEMAMDTTGVIYFNNGSTTVSPTGWLVYELANPVVTTFSEEISATARISDYGTEECLPVNGYDPVTAPFRGMVLYQDDYARTITKLPENYQSQDSMDNLLALIGPLLNGTITATFDSANQVYTYQFTPNA